MYQLNATYYSIADSTIEAKNNTVYDSLVEVAVMTQKIVTKYFTKDHPLYALHTPTPKEVIYYSYPGERMGDLVIQLKESEEGSGKEVMNLVLNHERRINSGTPFRVEISYYDHLNKRNTTLAVFTISKGN